MNLPMESPNNVVKRKISFMLDISMSLISYAQLDDYLCFHSNEMNIYFDVFIETRRK